ncbi:hypothetical protein SAMD00019534_069000 [Acytostelium subglobosum LB1]|uniref:hypothetical protein n=1 Tax=Acytostelium subglobosum LB1 TaxID=1410327 RepID=UPI0006450E1B|nr:hypothetical protein SAMD00019534_069000 [Acytostelium subglobosum LB1]GAM23725.1 hypothetical protein SAMD00019534_069000 [Acytostelium subglobosum LB1]|eukprot:XP_012753466.1 hypothetical protein SAMD00019534_069000 [Acytostelium subglobosum LB1]
MVRVVVQSNHVKTFAKGIQCLSKLCDEFNVDTDVDKIKFKACNASKSAYIEITMTESFFESYQVDQTAINARVRLKSKHCNQVFHSLASIAKVALYINYNEGKANFHLLCNKGIRKAYKLNYEELDMLNPVLNDDYDVRMTIKPKILLDALSHFTTNIEEISLVLGDDVIIFKTYIGEDNAKIAPDKTMQTEIKLDTSDFDEYHTDGRKDNFIDMTFSIKEFKTIMAFCETLGHPLTFYIKQNGNALKFDTKQGNSFFVQFLVACYQTPGSVNPSSTPSSSGSSSNNQRNNNTSQSSGNSHNMHYNNNSGGARGSQTRSVVAFDDSRYQQQQQQQQQYYQHQPVQHSQDDINNNSPRDFDMDMDSLAIMPANTPPASNTAVTSQRSRAGENPLSLGLRGQNLNVDDDDDDDDEDEDDDPQSVLPSQ